MSARSKQEIITAMDAIRSRMAEIDGNEWPTDEEVDEAESLPARLEELKTEAARADQEHADRVADVRRRALDPRAFDGPANPRHRSGGLSGGGDDVRSRAMRLVENAHRSGDLADEAAARAEALVKVPDLHARNRVTEWIEATGTPAYMRAVEKLVQDYQFGHRSFTPEEADAFARAEAHRRAMSLTDSAGGFMVPFILDPSLIITNVGTVNPMRQLATVKTIATDVWHGVSTAGVVAEWLAEAEEAADASPTFGSPDIKAEKAAAWVQGSFEVLADSGFARELGPLLADAKDRHEAVAFMVGDGIGKPEGVITGVAAVPGSRVQTAGSGAYAAQDVYALQAALPSRYQRNASWLSDLATINRTAQFETANGSREFPGLDAESPVLLRKRLYEASEMSGTISAGQDILLYGDLRQYYIVDRIGMTLVYEPLVKGANRRPTGEAGWFAYWRTGGAVVNPDALRILRVKA